MTTATIQAPENSLQTLVRWLGNCIGYATVGILVVMAIYITCWTVAAMISAMFIMVTGVMQSIRANKTGEVPLVTNACLYAVFYVVAVPTNIMLGGLAAWGGEECFPYALLAYKIMVMFSAYIVLRHLILPKLMRRSSLAVHTHTAWILTILLWPCYAAPLHKLGFSMMFYDLGDSFIEWLRGC